MPCGLKKLFKGLGQSDRSFSEKLAEKIPGAQPLEKRPEPVEKAGGDKIKGAIAAAALACGAGGCGKEVETTRHPIPRVSQSVPGTPTPTPTPKPTPDPKRDPRQQTLGKSKPTEIKPDKNDGSLGAHDSKVSEGPLNKEKLKNLVAEHKHYVKEIKSNFDKRDAQAAARTEQTIHEHEDQEDEGSGSVHAREDLRQAPKARMKQLLGRMKKRPEAAPVKDNKDTNALVKSKEKLPGGYGDGTPDSAVPKAAMKEGMKVEREHSPDIATRKEIIKDHQAENEIYYKDLKVMEDMAKKGRHISKLASLKKFAAGAGLNVASGASAQSLAKAKREGSDNSKVIGKVIQGEDGSWRWAKEGEKGYGVRKQSGYYRITSGPHRGRYLHSLVAEAKTGQTLDKESGKHVDHKDGNRAGFNLKVMDQGDHSGKTNTTRQDDGFSGEKRYYHSRDKGSY